ncbi:MAG TPA: DUF3644 domain-containing protein [Alphaproteobacteria bacterium]|nr:DUF3644 domain-containing protein [Alphaproteobacteria bacterium]
MQREAKILLKKAVDSLILAIEHFNRPQGISREEEVLILLDRSFELLLKAILVHKKRSIREKNANQTIGFDKCVRKCLSDGKAKCLTEEQALTLQIINSLRDAAQHYFLDISERQLYMYAQAGQTVFSDLLHSVFNISLSDYMPQRVLPISSSPPRDLHALIQAEFQDIKALLAPKTRKSLLAHAKLRPLAIVESSLSGTLAQPSDEQLKGLALQVQQGKSWQELFPGVASLNIDTQGTGLAVTIRITKKEGEPVHLVPEGTPGATVMAVKRVSELDFYNLGLADLANKCGLSQPKTLAVVRHLKLQESSDYFKEVRIGKSTFKRYSMQALDAMKRALPELDLELVWSEHGLGRGARAT